MLGHLHLLYLNLRLIYRIHLAKTELLDCRFLTQMDRRTKNSSNMRFASEELSSNYADFENEFTLFFEEIQKYCTQKLNNL